MNLSDAIMILKVTTKSDINHFLQIYTNYPDNLYICLVSHYKRELVFHLLSRYSVYMLFLPLKIAEITSILSRIYKEEEFQLIKTQFYKGMQYAKQNFTWKTAEIIISHKARLLSNLLRYMNFCRNELDEVNIRLGIEEMLINAIEHGSLELNSRDDAYEQLKKSRIDDVHYNQRLIQVELELKDGFFYISIEDEGPGFDTSGAKAIIEGNTDIPDSEILQPMGKGFWIVKNFFHSIEFQKKGRKIILGRRVLND